MSLAACEDDQSVASGSSTGSIHVWRVEYTTRAGGSAADKYTGGSAADKYTGACCGLG
jgi:hypothetical protein